MSANSNVSRRSNQCALQFGSLGLCNATEGVLVLFTVGAAC